MFSNNAVVDMTVTKTLDIMDKTHDISPFHLMLYIFQSEKYHKDKYTRCTAQLKFLCDMAC